MYIYIYIYIHIHIYTHIHIYIYIYIYTRFTYEVTFFRIPGTPFGRLLVNSTYRPRILKAIMHKHSTAKSVMFCRCKTVFLPHNLENIRGFVSARLPHYSSSTRRRRMRSRAPSRATRSMCRYFLPRRGSSEHVKRAKPLNWIHASENGWLTTPRPSPARAKRTATSRAPSAQQVRLLRQRSPRGQGHKNYLAKKRKDALMGMYKGNFDPSMPTPSASSSRRRTRYSMTAARP